MRKAPQHGKFLGFLKAHHVVYSGFIAVINCNRKEGKEVGIGAHTKHHDHALHGVLQISARVYIGEAESRHGGHYEKDRVYVFLKVGNLTLVSIIENELLPR